MGVQWIEREAADVARQGKTLRTEYTFRQKVYGLTLVVGFVATAILLAAWS